MPPGVTSVILTIENYKKDQLTESLSEVEYHLLIISELMCKYQLITFDALREHTDFSLILTDNMLILDSHWEVNHEFLLE
jgi:hypothetical protein